MQNLDYYLSLNYPILLTWDEDNEWVAQNPDLPGCAGDGATEEEAIASLRISRELWLKASLKHNLPIPEPVPA